MWKQFQLHVQRRTIFRVEIDTPEEKADISKTRDKIIFL